MSFLLQISPDPLPFFFSFNFEQHQMKLKSNCTLEDYINFHGNHTTQFISRESLNQILQMHGFQKLHNTRKKVITDVLNTLDLISPYRSSLTQSVSASASLTTEDVNNDLHALQWIKCSLRSIKTFNSPKHLENTATSNSSMLTENTTFEVKRMLLDLENTAFEVKPTLLEDGTIETKPTILADGTLLVKPTVLENEIFEMKPTLLENGMIEMKPMLLENGMIEMKPMRTRVRQQQKNQARKKRTLVTSVFDIAAANAVSAFWLSKVDCR